MVLPYLVSVLGVARYGIVALAQSFVFYWIMFTDYGFNLSTTRAVALYKHDQERLSLIASSTLLAKLVLCFTALLAFMILVNFVPAFREHRPLYYFGFLMVAGQAMMPVWFFQGMEEMKFLTYINIAGKAIQTILIFLLIKSPADYIYVLLFYGLGNLFSGVCGLWLMVRQFAIRLKIPPGQHIIQELRNGWFIFLSHFSINIYTNSNIFILGFFASDTIVGYFSIADKVVAIARQLLMIFFQSTYPNICKQVLKGHRFVIEFFRSFFVLFAAGIIMLCLLIFLFAEPITVFFAGAAVQEIIRTIRWLIVVPLIVCLNLPAFQTLLAYNYQKSYMVIFIAGSILNILLNIILARYFSVSGTVAAIIITELFITVGLHTILHVRHPATQLMAKWRSA